MTEVSKPHSIPWLVGNVERAVQIAPWEIQTNARVALDALVHQIAHLEEQLETYRKALERIADSTEMTGDGPLEPILADPTGTGERELKARMGLAERTLSNPAKERP